MIRSAHVLSFSVLLGLGASLSARADDSKPGPAPAATAPAAAPPAAAPGAGRAFTSPEEAARALGAALGKNDDQGLRDVLGPGADDIVELGRDPIVAASRLAIAADLEAKLAVDSPNAQRVTLLLGTDGWPFPIPVAKAADGWRFDVAAGREEVLARQIGRHELEVIGICRGYPEIQAAYAAKDRDGDGVREFAQRIQSTEGQQDGLYWRDRDDEEQAPLGLPLAALKSAEKPGKGPYAGYFWRILKGQGSHAPGGAYSFVINGNMIAGYALLAVPAEHRKTGVMTFLVSQHGKVFQKDLGANSLDLARAIEVYDPDDTWDEVETGDEVPLGSPTGSSVSPTNFAPMK